ncbi:hypothetical protein H4R19_001289 [Coemansia spiralis]|nr:hypothetical protein H4R19_001289 [Coemansia spiralis]
MSFMKWMSGTATGLGAVGSSHTAANGAGGAVGHRGLPDNDDRFYGLVNVGNTCYCSSVLQSLYFCRAFRDCVNNYPHPQAGMAAQTLERPALVLGANGSNSPDLGLQPTDRADGWEGSRSVSGGADVEAANGRGKTLSSFRERAAGLRRRKDQTSAGAGLASPPAAATDSTANGSGESKESSGTAGSVDAGGSAGVTAGAADPPEPPDAGLPAASGDGVGSSLFTELKDLFWTISTQTKRTGSLSPQRLIAKLKEVNELFRSNAHQDAHELLNFLLNEILENVAGINKRLGLERFTGAPLEGPNWFQGRTWVHTLFEGLLTNETRCLSCESVTSRDETILDVSVDINEHTSVTSCLNQFAAGELLCHNNKFYCDSCGGLQEAELRMRLKRLPNILALHLKRFKYHEGLGRYVKLSYRVNFPTELRVPNTTEDTRDVLYTLSGIVVHLGGGPLHGHYISIVRSADRWVLFDDDCVEVIAEHELGNYFGDYPNFGSGYVLFYERTDFDPAQFDLPRPHAPDPRVPPAPPAASSTPRAGQVTPPAPAAAKTFAAPAQPQPLIATTRTIHNTGAGVPAQMAPPAAPGQPQVHTTTTSIAAAATPPGPSAPSTNSSSGATADSAAGRGSRLWFGRRGK